MEFQFQMPTPSLDFQVPLNVDETDGPFKFCQILAMEVNVSEKAQQNNLLSI